MKAVDDFQQSRVRSIADILEISGWCPWDQWLISLRSVADVLEISGWCPWDQWLISLRSVIDFLEISAWFPWDQCLISNTPSQAGSKISFIFNLLIIELNIRLRTPLVKTSATYNLEEMNRVQIIPLAISSLMKCLFISICFVPSCCTGLRTMLMVDSLVITI